VSNAVLPASVVQIGGVNPNSQSKLRVVGTRMIMLALACYKTTTSVCMLCGRVRVDVCLAVLELDTQDDDADRVGTILELRIKVGGSWRLTSNEA
jgi:hypothetical protein